MSHDPLMTRDDVLYDDIQRMDGEIETIIGRPVFGHIACPTETSQRITFGDGTVCLTMSEAHGHMRHLLITALRSPAELPWPLCEPARPPAWR